MQDKLKILFFRFLGIYQIAGGLFGYYLVFQEEIIYVLSKFVYFILILIGFSFSIICGIVLLGRNIKKGLKFSLINQFFQLFQFELLGYGIYYVAGSYISVGFSDSPTFHILYDSSLFRSAFYISLFLNKNEITISLNIVALFIIIIINRVYNVFIKSKHEEE